jgi:hypothetical protein
MPGLDPGIHSVTASRERNGMDAMVKPWHDDKLDFRRRLKPSAVDLLPSHITCR